jgi:DNA-binding MarR family transcriptional regulator
VTTPSQHPVPILLTARPKEGPNSWNLREVLAYVLVEWSSTSSEFVKIPRRMLQRDWGRVNGRRVSKALKTLVEDGWLKMERSQEPGRAYSYQPGRRLRTDKNLFQAWLNFSNSVFGSDGLLGELRFRPARCFGVLNTSGLLVLAAILRSPSIRTMQLVKLLAPVLSRKTVLSYIRRLEEAEIIERTSDGISASNTWESKLASLESESHASTRKTKVRLSTYQETIIFQEHFHPEMQKQEPENCWWRLEGAFKGSCHDANAETRSAIA